MIAVLSPPSNTCFVTSTAEDIATSSTGFVPSRGEGRSNKSGHAGASKRDDIHEQETTEYDNVTK